MNDKILNGMFWKLLERYGVFGVQFVLQIVLARMLDPAYYGMLTIMLIFTTLANVFVQQGFNTALIQNKDVTEEDYSSVFWVSLGIAGALYVLLYVLAPVIADFYEMPQILTPFRVLCLMLLPGAFNSVQLAKVSREMNFRKVFFGNVGGIVVSGIAGIGCALGGLGLWALVVQSITNVVVSCLVMMVLVRWRPRLVCDLRRVGVLFGFGWKMLASALLDTLYADLTSLVVGKKYDASTLGYYNRGKQFPQVLMNPINGALQSVLLPAMSQQQEDRQWLRQMVRRSITLGSFLIFPMMAGLAGIAQSMVQVLLTDKWLPCVPFLQLFCVSYAFYHIHSTNLQAISAMGRSDIFLKLEILKKSIGMSALCISVFCFDSPAAIAASTVFTAPISLMINAFPNQKLIGYSLREQLQDILPTLLIALGMFFAVLGVQLLELGAWATLLIQVPVGVGVYLLLAAAFRLEAWKLCLELVKARVSKARGK